MSTEKNKAQTEAGVQVIELEASYSDFALAAGLPHDATKGDVLAAMGRAKASQAKLLEAHGAKSPEEAIGKLEAERTTHASLVQAVVGGLRNATTEDAIAKLASDRKAAEGAQAKALIDEARAQGKTVGEKTQAIFDKHGMEALQAHLDALVAHGPLVNPGPSQRAGNPSPTTPGATSTTPGASSGGTEIAVKLTAADEHMIKEYGLDREKFVATRRAQLESAKEAQE